MRAFISNPLEAILNAFGYTLQSKPSLLGMHIVDFTHSSWVQDLQSTGRITDYEVNLYTK